jgi:hypothetical protein
MSMWQWQEIQKVLWSKCLIGNVKWPIYSNVDGHYFI